MALRVLVLGRIGIIKVNVGRNVQSGKRDYIFTLEVPYKVTEDDLLNMFKQYTCKVKEKE